MITKDVAERLLLVVNDPHNLAALKDYINERIEWNKDQLSSCADQRNIVLYQGAIKELRTMLLIREVVLQFDKKD
jgi:hypothetical protein